MLLRDGDSTARKVTDFLAAYAECLDDDRLEEWPSFFLDDGCYKIISRENERLGLPAPIVYHYSRGMLEDRVTALRGALTYEFVYTRHVTSAPRIAPLGSADVVAARSNFVIYHSGEEGRSHLYAVGSYRDEIRIPADGPLLFRSRTVVVDSFAIPNLLALPL